MDYNDPKIRALNIREDIEQYATDMIAADNGDNNGDDNYVLLPATDSEVFGYITEDTSLSGFLSKNHYPTCLKIQDPTLTGYVKTAKILSMENQYNRFGKPVKIKAAATIEIPVKVYQINFPTPSRIDSLYETLVEKMEDVIKGLSGSLKDQIQKQFEARVEDGTLFKVATLETVNVITNQRCLWTWVGAKNNKKLVLVGIDDKSYFNYTHNELMEAADDMMVDECKSYINVVIRQSPKCG